MAEVIGASNLYRNVNGQAVKYNLYRVINGALVRVNEYVYTEPEAVTHVEFTLSANYWNGTTYEIEVTEYGEAGELLIGIPPASNPANARLLERCALTIVKISNTYTKTDMDGDGEKETNVYTSTTITISAVTAPTEDVTIAIWGLLHE